MATSEFGGAFAEEAIVSKQSLDELVGERVRVLRTDGSVLYGVLESVNGDSSLTLVGDSLGLDNRAKTEVVELAEMQSIARQMNQADRLVLLAGIIAAVAAVVVWFGNSIGSLTGN